jgi:hypothetical protein
MKIPAHKQFRASPSNCDKQPNQRNVSVTVSHGLHADLHNADNGNKRAEEPKPADEKIRTTTGKPDCERRNSHEK